LINWSGYTWMFCVDFEADFICHEIVLLEGQEGQLYCSCLETVPLLHFIQLAISLELNKERPTWSHLLLIAILLGISPAPGKYPEELLSSLQHGESLKHRITCFLFHYLMLNMFRMLTHPSSGACDLFVELFHGLYCSGSMCVGATLWWCGIRMQAESSASACIRIPHHPSQTTT